MLQEKHHQLLDQLRFGQSFSERKNALISLKALEDSGLTKEVDIKALLNENNSVTRNYAIGAAGRLKIKDLKSKLINDFDKSFDPLILISYIEAFISYNQADFVIPITDKIKVLQQPSAKKSKQQNLEDDFILEQIIIPCLKYLEKHGNKAHAKLIKSFLNDDDANVRWHALKMIDQFQIDLPKNQLIEIIEKDSSRLNREQATIMLEKSKPIR
jgi:hypothetical protein